MVYKSRQALTICLVSLKKLALKTSESSLWSSMEDMLCKQINVNKAETLLDAVDNKNVSRNKLEHAKIHKNCEIYSCLG